MFWVAVVGLIANAVAFRILHRSHDHDVNMRGALLHVMGDMLGSVAAIIAAVVIGLTGWMPIDPLLSLVVAGLIGISAIRLIRETTHILLEGAPEDIDVLELAAGLKTAAPAIKDVHHVQIWQITPGNAQLTLHACVENAEDAAAAMEAAKDFLERKYKISETTIQMEVGQDCPDRILAAAAKQATEDEHHHVANAGSSSVQAIAAHEH